MERPMIERVLPAAAAHAEVFSEEAIDPDTLFDEERALLGGAWA